MNASTIRATRLLLTAFVALLLHSAGGTLYGGDLEGLQDKAVTLPSDALLQAPEDFDADVSYTIAQEAPRVEMVRYERLPDHPGNPWSHWGPGIIHANGNYYCAQGTHTPLDGNALIYEFDPDTRVLRAVADLWEPFAPWPKGLSEEEHTDDGKAFGFGKIHGRLNEAKDGAIYFASYYGHARNGSEWFYGDRIFKFDPQTSKVTDLGRPHRGMGYPSTHFSPEHGLLYMEAFHRRGVAWGDPEKNYLSPKYDAWSDGYQIRFMAYDVEKRETVFVGEHPHDYGRDMFVDQQGNAYYNNGNGTLRKYDPEANETTVLDVKMPGNNIRRTAIDDNGMMYGALLDTKMLFAFDPEEPAVREITKLMGDAASLAVDPQGRYAYYLPGSHGSKRGAPIVQVDLESGKQKVIAFLEDVAREQAELYLGGSLSGLVAPDGRTLYYTLHAGTEDGFRYENEALFIIHVPASEIE